MNAEKYLQLLKEIKSVTFATVDSDGHPQVRIINVMIVEDEKLYFVTAKGKSFYRQLMEQNEAAVLGLTKNRQAIRLNAKVKKMDVSWLDRIFEENPNMAMLYPGEKRYICDAFCLYAGYGECFDLGRKPCERDSFTIGGVQESPTGFLIDDSCTACGLCAENCPLKCIEAGKPYTIAQKHCIHCGICVESCPVQAIVRRDGRMA